MISRAEYQKRQNVAVANGLSNRELILALAKAHGFSLKEGTFVQDFIPKKRGRQPGQKIKGGYGGFTPDSVYQEMVALPIGGEYDATQIVKTLGINYRKWGDRINQFGYRQSRLNPNRHAFKTRMVGKRIVSTRIR